LTTWTIPDPGVAATDFLLADGGASVNGAWDFKGVVTFDNAPVFSSPFTSITTAALKVTTSPTTGYVLTSDTLGNATWQAVGGGGSGGQPVPHNTKFVSLGWPTSASAQPTVTESHPRAIVSMRVVAVHVCVGLFHEHHSGACEHHRHASRDRPLAGMQTAVQSRPCQRD
jgi:hypothetical protein